MRKFVILDKADMTALCLNKPVDFCIDGIHGVLCTEDYYLKNVVNQQPKTVSNYEDIKIKLKQFLMESYDIRPSLSDKTVEEMFKRGLDVISFDQQTEKE